MLKSEKTKQFIVATVAPIFNKKGYAATSLADLTKATGLTKGSIYGNFKDKNQVAQEAFKYNLSELSNKVKVYQSGQTGAYALLQAFFEFYEKEYAVVMENGGCAMLNAAVDSDYTNPELRTLVKDAFGSWFQTIADLVVKGQEQGTIKNGVDAGVFSGMCLALIEGSLLLTKATGDSRYIKNNIKLLIRKLEEIKA